MGTIQYDGGSPVSACWSFSPKNLFFSHASNCLRPAVRICAALSWALLAVVAATTRAMVASAQLRCREGRMQGNRTTATVIQITTLGPAGSEPLPAIGSTCDQRIVSSCRKGSLHDGKLASVSGERFPAIHFEADRGLQCVSRGAGSSGSAGMRGDSGRG